MEGMIVLIVLAAIGVLSILWAMLGFLLPGQRGAVLVCMYHGNGKEEALIRRYRWLRDVGLIRSPLVLVAETPQETETERLLKQGVELCSREELEDRLEQERKRLG